MRFAPYYDNVRVGETSAGHPAIVIRGDDGGHNADLTAGITEETARDLIDDLEDTFGIDRPMKRDDDPIRPTTDTMSIAAVLTLAVGIEKIREEKTRVARNNVMLRWEEMIEYVHEEAERP